MILQAAIQSRVMELCSKSNTALDVMPGFADFFQRSTTPDLSVVEDLCDALGITLADFFCCDTFRNIEKE